MSRSPKFLAARHVAARIVLQTDDIVLDDDGSVIPERGNYSSNQRHNIVVLALLIIDHLGESVPELDDDTIAKVRADKGLGRTASRMQVLLLLNSDVVRREWPSLLEHYEAEARERTTAIT